MKVPRWVLALLAVVFAAGLWWANELREGKGRAEQVAVTLRDSAEAEAARADSAARRLEVVEDSLDSARDSLLEVGAELTAALQSHTRTILSTIDTVEAALPEDQRHLAGRLRAQVDSLERTIDRREANWQARFELQQRRIVELRGALDQERAAREELETALEAAHDALNPPAWTLVARNLPELGAKAGGGYLACERSVEACIAYLGGLAIDLAFDV